MNSEIIQHLKKAGIKAGEMTLAGKTYVVGTVRGQRFSIKYADEEFQLWSGFSASTLMNSCQHLSNVSQMVKRWAA